MKVDFTLNGKKRFIDLPPHATLLDIIRNDFDLLSVHPGCKRGYCGACTVLLDNHLAASCMIPLFHLKGRTIETVEHVLDLPGFRDIELGFLRTGFHPCKFCAGIKVLTAEAILREWEHPKTQDMRSYITRNWCTCTAPTPFFEAVQFASEYRERRGHAARH